MNHEQTALANTGLIPPAEDIPDFETPILPPLDRSTAEDFATCPLMAWLIQNGRVINSSLETASGQAVHDCLSEVTQEYVAADAGMFRKGELADMLRSLAAHSRVDVQPDVIAALRKSVWDWCEFITNISPTNILRFDGGTGIRSGQIGMPIPQLNVTATTELDFLYAGASPQQVHIVDYKSGYAHWTAADVKDAFQFQMQGLLTLENYPAVESVEVRIWNTRTNRITYGVEIERRYADDVKRRITNAAALAVQHGKATAPEQVPAWPTEDRCGMCRAAVHCHATPPSEVENDPANYVLTMNALEAKLKAMEKAASAFVDKTGADIVAGSLRFGRQKPSERQSTAKLYSVKG